MVGPMHVGEVEAPALADLIELICWTLDHRNQKKNGHRFLKWKVWELSEIDC